MTDQHRKRRPRVESFEMPVLKAAPGDSVQFPYLVRGQNPSTFKQISSRLRKTLDHIYRVEFLRSKVNYHAEPDSDDWKIWRYLGNGSYGSVALWIKRDGNGNIIDEIVMKEVARNDTGIEWDSGEPHLTSEAVLLSTVNKMSCQSKCFCFCLFILEVSTSNVMTMQIFSTCEAIKHIDCLLVSKIYVGRATNYRQVRTDFVVIISNMLLIKTLKHFEFGTKLITDICQNCSCGTFSTPLPKPW